MEILNYDCVHMILDFLSLKDQISIADASVRMQPHVYSYWIHKHKNFNLLKDYEKVNDRKFDGFLKIIDKHVKSVEMYFIACTPHEVFFEHTYSKCMELKYHSFDIDDELILVKKSFPNIKTFHPYGSFSGKGIVEWWPDLEHLSLSDCNRLQFKHILKILQNLNLKTLKLYPHIDDPKWSIVNINDFVNLHQLEVIKVNMHYYDILLFKNIIPNLKRLREFTITYTTYSEHKAIAIQDFLPKSNDLIEIYTDYNGLKSNADFSAFSNLQKLTINSSYNRNRFTIKSDSLTALCFFATHFESEKELEKILLKHKNIELLTIEECDFDHPVNFNVARIVDGRKTQLVLNFVNNYCKKKSMQLELRGSSRMLATTVSSKRNLYPLVKLRLKFESKLP